MKKQKNSSIKAQLIRRASLSLLLVAVCIIPFAWGQRNTVRTATAQIKRNAVAHPPQMTNLYGRAPVVSRKSPIAPFLLNVPLGGTCPSTITQSTSQAIVSVNSVACNNGVGLPRIITGALSNEHFYRRPGIRCDVGFIRDRFGPIWKWHGPAVDSQSLCKQRFTVPRRRLAVESDRYIGRT